MSLPVQHVAHDDGSTGAFGNTVTATISGLHAGAPLVVFGGHDGNPLTTVSVADDLNPSGGTYVQRTTVERAFDVCNYGFTLASTLSGTANVTMSFTGTGSLVGKWIAVYELAVSATYDHSITNQQVAPTAGLADAATSTSTGNTTTAGVLVAFCYVDSGSPGTDPTTAAGTGFTDDGQAAVLGLANGLARLESKAVSSAGVAATFTRPVGGDPGDHITHAIVFADAGGGSTIDVDAGTDTPAVTDTSTRGAEFGRFTYQTRFFLD